MWRVKVVQQWGHNSSNFKMTSVFIYCSDSWTTNKTRKPMGIVNSNYSLSSLVSLDRAHYPTSLRHFGDFKPWENSVTTTVKGKRRWRESSHVVLIPNFHAVNFSTAPRVNKLWVPLKRVSSDSNRRGILSYLTKRLSCQNFVFQFVFRCVFRLEFITTVEFTFTCWRNS